MPWAPKYLPCDSLIVTVVVTWCFQLRLLGVKEHATLTSWTESCGGCSSTFFETINIGEDKWISRASDSSKLPAVNKKEYA